jgi:hypothetical protein
MPSLMDHESIKLEPVTETHRPIPPQRMESQHQSLVPPPRPLPAKSSLSTSRICTKRFSILKVQRKSKDIPSQTKWESLIFRRCRF